MTDEQIMDETEEELEQEPEAPIEVNQDQNMSDGLDMEYGLGNLAPKNNSDGFDMGLDLGLDF